MANISVEIGVTNIGIRGEQGIQGIQGASGFSTIGGFPVNVSGEGSGDVLQFNGLAWVNVDAAELVDGGTF